MMIASTGDGIYLDISKELEVDLDEEYHIKGIKEIIYDRDSSSFYLLANQEY